MKMKTAYMMMALAAALAARAEYQYVFDTSGAPELAEWTATNLAPVVREWYPKLVEMFPSEGWTAPEKVSFRYREGLPHPAHTVKDEVTTLRSWYTDNPGDVGCAVHELFHVVQGGYRRAPGWLTEGIADYVRWYLFEPGSHGCDMDVKSKDNNWAARRVDLAHMIEDENPDVIGFQEVLPPHGVCAASEHAPLSLRPLPLRRHNSVQIVQWMINTFPDMLLSQPIGSIHSV